jgi:ATP-dependent exoDNAse (exonuclease V) beta subunit
MPPGDYVLDGEQIPSVTEVVAQMKSSYKSASIEEAARLGTAIHSLIERSFADAVDVVPDELLPAWQAWCQWRFDREPLLHRLPGHLPAAEVRVVASVPRELAFGGRIDLVVEVDNRLILIDIKTKSTNESGQLPAPDRYSYTQLGGYSIAWRQSGYDKLAGAMVLHLGRNAPIYREHWVPIDALWMCETEFLCCRTMLQQHELRKKRLKEERA